MSDDVVQNDRKFFNITYNHRTTNTKTENETDFISPWRIVKLSATVCQKILHMGFHSLTLCEDVDLTAFGGAQRPVPYNYQYLFAQENIPELIHLYSHLFHAVQANMDRANRQ